MVVQLLQSVFFHKHVVVMEEYLVDVSLLILHLCNMLLAAIHL